MKALKQFYYILSYVMFILPPFIWGLVELYVENREAEVHIISLFVNLIVLAILGLVSTILMKQDKIHVPSGLEYRYLLFGLVGNIVVYFYTFQNMMEIQNIITIYLILLIVLAVRYFLITKTIRVWELWIILPIFLVIDTLHILVYGCGVMNNVDTICYPNDVAVWVMYLLYIPLVVASLGLYGYRIYQYKRFNFWGISHIVLVLFIAFYIQDFVEINEKLMGTVSIAAGFLVILDFIVSIVNKTYSHRTLTFYLRTGTFLILSMLLAEEGFFQGEASNNMLILMVLTTYASLGIAILKSLLHVQEETDQIPVLDIDFVLCSDSLREQIKQQYGDVAFRHIGMDDTHYSLIAVQDDIVLGFISSYLQPIYKGLFSSKEAYINIIEVHKDRQREGIATELLRRSELYFRKQGAKQIRAWSSDDKEACIQLWDRLGYNISPTTIYLEKIQQAVSGVYAIKQL